MAEGYSQLGALLPPGFQSAGRGTLGRGELGKGLRFLPWLSYMENSRVNYMVSRLKRQNSNLAPGTSRLWFLYIQNSASRSGICKLSVLRITEGALKGPVYRRQGKPFPGSKVGAYTDNLCTRQKGVMRASWDIQQMPGQPGK